MTREELWKAYTERNKWGEQGEAVISMPTLRKLFDQIWDKAEEHGKAEARKKQGVDLGSIFRGAGF